jgi:hypothetical protein
MKRGFPSGAGGTLGAAVAIGLLWLSSSQAQEAQGSEPVKSAATIAADGLLEFPHVRVVTPDEVVGSAPEALGQAASVAFIDPLTGRLTSAPDGENPAAEMFSPIVSINDSHSGLFEVPSPLGGFKLDVQGRFRSALMAAIVSGTLHIGHAQPTAVVSPPLETTSTASEETNHQAAMEGER